MAYERRTWQDQIKDSSGNIIQQGTPFSAGQMNNIYDGLDLSHLNIGLLALSAMQLANINKQELQKYKNQRLLQGQATITNSDTSGYFRSSDPFVSIALSGYQQINYPNYTVLVEVLSADDPGRVGDLIVYGKTQNGFNVKMTGSAKTVSFLWTLINPNV
ncbi:signal transduction protein [Heyndrickxia coagulans]|uniref:signal transduction protein n=1 Tax=Heyndrickxia coagulans TaxID=1398 RepID=UPI0022366E13|nr:signal transduction protein [Heyndrickxia coagulans]UZH06464.1 signal transduction protein [Heyndrickxia coagulans]